MFNLPKWPACIVIGDSVTMDQAAEIILRTSGLYFSSNDKSWDRQCYELIGATYDDDDSWHPSFASTDQAREKLGILDLSYMHTDRIASSYMGGPNGWINWNGHIHQTNKNIGKWPDHEDVLEDWKIIAATFPYLNLKCQLFDGEYCEDDIKPVVEYQIHHGQVISLLPTEEMIVTQECDMSIEERFSNPFAERGCTLHQLERAVSLCQKD